MDKKLTTQFLRSFKESHTGYQLQMLTCYDYQTARMLDDTGLDLILVGDSVGNVVLGYETTVEVTLAEMEIFAAAVKRGAPKTFVVADLPFGTYATIEQGIKNSCQLFQKSRVEALKLEGASKIKLQLIEQLTDTGIPVMGHIGLTPQSIHEQGGYYLHGKGQERACELIQEAQNLEKAGVFAIVLECIVPEVAQEITKNIKIPTIGIGSGPHVDGEVLVINDLLKQGPEKPPKFCTPITDLYQHKKALIEKFLASKGHPSAQTRNKMLMDKMKSSNTQLNMSAGSSLIS